jgi:transposase
VPVFGLLKRGGKVYAVVIADAKATTLLPILKERIVPDAIVYSDALPSDNALAVAGFRHLRINHAKRFADGKNHINGIENFWNQAKRHRRKFNGVPKKHFPLFLKECERRFNNPNPQTQLKQLNQWVHQLLTWLSRTAPFIFLVALDSAGGTLTKLLKSIPRL